MKKSDNDDLVTLTNLNEQIVLDELKQRYFKNKIYVS
jgi:myosin heavy subunit